MNALEVVISELLGAAARLAVALDPEHQQHLNRLEGQSLRIACSSPPQEVTLRVAAGALDLLPGSRTATDATIGGRLPDLLAFLRGQTPQQALEVSGDPAVLRDFGRLFADFQPDWNALVPEQLRGIGAFGSGPLASGANAPAAGALFEQLRGIAEVGFASLGKVLQTAIESGVDAAPGAATEAALQAAEQRAARLRQSLATLTTRIDALDRTSQNPS